MDKSTCHCTTLHCSAFMITYPCNEKFVERHIRLNVIIFIDVGSLIDYYCFASFGNFLNFWLLWHLKTSMLRDIFNFLLQDDMAGYMIMALSGFRYSYCYWLIFLLGELKLTRHLPPSLPSFDLNYKTNQKKKIWSWPLIYSEIISINQCCYVWKYF